MLPRLTNYASCVEIQVSLRRKFAGNSDVAVFIRYGPFQEAQIVNGGCVRAFGSCHRSTGKDAERGEQRPRKPHHYNMYVFLFLDGGHA